MLERERTAALARGRAPAVAAREAFNMVTIIDKMQMRSRVNDRFCDIFDDTFDVFL
jgi:hypothetical protein